MEYQKTMNLLGDRTNHPFKIRTENLVEINDKPRKKHVRIIKINLKFQ